MNPYTYRTAARHAWVAAAGSPVWCVCDAAGRSACGRGGGEFGDSTWILAHESAFTENPAVCRDCLAALTPTEGANHER